MNVVRLIVRDGRDQVVFATIPTKRAITTVNGRVRIEYEGFMEPLVQYLPLARRWELTNFGCSILDVRRRDVPLFVGAEVV